MSPSPKFAKDFWPVFRTSLLWLIVGIIIVSIGAMAAILYALGLFESHLVAAISILALHGLLVSAVAILLYGRLAQPLRDIIAAIVHISGDRTTTTPPNPNDERFAKNGFRDVLQTLYQLASNNSSTVEASSDSSSTGTVSSASGIQSALDQTNCGFVAMNHQRQITYANKNAPVDINKEGQSELHLLFSGTDTLTSWLNDCDSHAVNAERVWRRVPNKLPEEENRRFFDVYATYSKGAPNETVVTLVDRTETYSSSEEDLDFIAFAAHELRGPITVIRGYLDVLQQELQPQLANDQVELFHRLSVSANRLSGYINNILNTSRYDRRHLKMHLVETTAVAIFDIIRDDMALRASAQGRLLNATIPTDLPTIAADPASLSEVYGNLIDNAIKYSNEGGTITVTAELKGDFVDISVIDQGIGMPGNVVNNLFQKFYRSHRSRETVAGTGIGLYISKAIVDSHGGTLSVRSEENKGSTFTLSIPTYQSVADKLHESDNSNEAFIKQGSGWIKNHSMYRG